jgi:SAM-dependent methyltransferase
MKKEVKPMSHRRFDPSKKAKLDDPERKKALPPEKILAMLEIKETDTVLDLGAGTGYFTLPAASFTSEKVYALDIEPEMLKVLDQRIKDKGLKNVQLLEGAIEQIPLADLQVDKVIASLVLHEVEPLSSGIQEIKRVLKPGGRCLCLEWQKKETEQGPPLDHRIDAEELKQVFLDEGFQIAQITYPTTAHYIMVVAK